MEHLKQMMYHLLDESKLIDFRKELKAYSDGYIPYLKNLIKLNSDDMEWVNTARDYPELLNFFPSQPRPFESYGTTDVAVVLRSALRAGQPEEGLLVLFDITRDMGEEAHGAAVMRLIVANLKSPDTRPVVVMTNLQSQWHMLWMDGNKVIEQPLKGNGHAAYTLQLALGLRQATDAKGDQAFANRQRIADERIPQQREVKLEVRPEGITFL